jgi:3-oxoacyl-[acyl-carrier protein] reductase
MGTLDGQIAVVTGASRGIGLAIAEAFVREGARVAICARDPRRLAESANRLKAVAIRCDVSQSEEVRRLAAEVHERLGAPHVVVNNAGIVVRKRLDDLEESEWSAVIGANLDGTYRVTRAFLPAMRARKSGRIINVASISGRQGTATLTSYCAAKHGVVGFTRALAEETRDVNVQVNAICPGSVDTDMLAGSGFPPLMSPADVAGVALYLAAHAPAALTGACLDVFG